MILYVIWLTITSVTFAVFRRKCFTSQIAGTRTSVDMRRQKNRIVGNRQNPNDSNLSTPRLIFISVQILFFSPMTCTY